MNRLTCIFLFLLSTSFSIGNAATGISLGNVTVHPGDTARVKVSLNDSVALGGFQFIVTPSPTGNVTFLSAAVAGRAAGWTVSANASGNGTIVVLYSSTGSSLAAGSDSVLILSYLVSKTAAAGTYELQLSDVRVSDADLRPLTDLTINHGSVTVPGVTPAENRVTISLDNASAYPGDTATLSLKLDNSVAVGGLQFLLSPSPAGTVSLLSASTAGRASGWTLSSNASGQGTLFILYSSSGATLASGKDNILVLKYLVPYGTSSGNIYLQVSDVRLSDSNLNPITDFSATGGSITVNRLAAQVNFTLDSVRVFAGGTATVRLTLNNAVAVSGFQFIITPTPAGRMTFSQVTAVGRASGWTVSSNQSGEGLMVVLYSPTGAILASGKEAVLSFQYNIGAQAQLGGIQLGLSEIRVSDSNLEPVSDFSTTNGLITVSEPLKVLGVEPSSVYQEAKDFVLKVTGEKFKTGARVEIGGGGILVTKTDFIDSLHLSATMTVSSFAVPGKRDVLVVNPDGGTGSGTGLLEVKEYPAVLEVNPFYLVQGTDSLQVSISGKALAQGATASFSGTGIRVLKLDYVGSTQLVALVSVDKTAAPGRRNLALTVSGIQITFADAVEIKANLPPQIILPDRWTVNEGEYLSFQVDGLDPEGGPLYFQASGLPAGASFEGRSFNWTPGFEAQGVYTVKFSVTDRLDAVAQGSVVITVLNRNRPPAFLELTDHKANAGELMTFKITARDPDKDKLELGATGFPTGAVLSRDSDSSFTFSWTPTESDMGTFRTAFTVSDPYGGENRGSLALTVEVPQKAVNLPPVFKNLTSLETEEGERLEVILQAEDPNGDPVVIYSGSLPQHADFDPVTSRLTFRPDYTQAGVYQLKFFATDGSLSTGATAMVIVKNKDIAPVFLPVGALATDEGKLFSAAFTAVDSGGDVLSYEAENLPRGAYLDPRTGNFFFTPDYNQEGSYSIKVKAKDPGGQTAETTAAITVNHANQPPVLGFIPSQFVESGQTVEFLVSAFDQDQDALTFSFVSNNLPENLFDAQTQVFKATAGEAGVFEGTFIVTDIYGASDSQVVAVNVGPKTNLPPAVTAIPDQFFVEGDTVTLTLSATDPEGASLSYSVFNQNELPSAMRQIGAQGKYKFYADYTTAGRYRVVFQVSDGVLSTRAEVKINIENRNRPPVLMSVGNQQVAEGGELELKISAADPDGDALSYEISGLPRGAGFDKRTGILVFRPDFDQADTVTLGVSVSDGQASASENFSLVITSTNRAPVLRQVRDPQVLEGGLLEFETDADDPDGDSVWVLIDKSKMPFLGEVVRKAAEIRNGRSFLFDTGNLVKEIQIPSGILKFYALDEHGAKSEEQLVDMAVIRKLVQKVLDLSAGQQKSFDWEGVGVNMKITNNSSQVYVCDINVSEQSGRFKQQFSPVKNELLSLVLAGLNGKRAWSDRYRYTYLSADGEEKVFYGIRRGWELNVCRPSADTKITTELNYSDKDLLEIEGFKESGLNLYGLDKETGQFVKVENSVVDTVKNSVTFEIKNDLITDYTLGVEMTPTASELVLQVEVLVDGEVLEKPRTSSTQGPYSVRTFAPQGALVTEAVLYYRFQSVESYRSLKMNRVTGGLNGYSADIPGRVAFGDIQYYVQMTVNFEQVASPLNPVKAPHTLTVAPKYIAGDANSDGVINIFDLLGLLKELGGSGDHGPGCDANSDGSVNIFDLLALLRMLAGS